MLLKLLTYVCYLNYKFCTKTAKGQSFVAQSVKLAEYVVASICLCRKLSAFQQGLFM